MCEARGMAGCQTTGSATNSKHRGRLKYFCLWFGERYTKYCGCNILICLYSWMCTPTIVDRYGLMRVFLRPRHALYTWVVDWGTAAWQCMRREHRGGNAH